MRKILLILVSLVIAAVLALVGVSQLAPQRAAVLAAQVDYLAFRAALH